MQSQSRGAERLRSHARVCGFCRSCGKAGREVQPATTVPLQCSAQREHAKLSGSESRPQERANTNPRSRSRCTADRGRRLLERRLQDLGAIYKTRDETARTKSCASSHVRPLPVQKRDRRRRRQWLSCAEPDRAAISGNPPTTPSAAGYLSRLHAHTPPSAARSNAARLLLTASSRSYALLSRPPPRLASRPLSGTLRGP